MSNSKIKPFYKKWWFIVLIVIFVIGALDSKSDEYSKITESAEDLKNDIDDDRISLVNEKNQFESERVPKTEDIVDPNVRSIIEHMGLTLDEAEEVFDDLRSVGLSSIEKIAKDAGSGVDNFQSFFAECDGHKTAISIENRKTYYIGVGVIRLFDVSKGGVVDNFQDYSLQNYNPIYYMTLAEEYIKLILKSPSTSKFPGHIKNYNDWSVNRYKNVVAVSSYVDSQNSFGAMIKNEFTVQIDTSSDNLLYIFFDGEEVYGKKYPMSKQ